jgi:hypothetical protein
MAVHNLRDLRFTFGSSTPMPYAVSFDEALKDAVQILARSTSPNMNRQQMLKGGMSLACIWSLHQLSNLRDLRFTFGSSTPMPYAVSFDEALKDAVTTAPAGYNDQNVLLAKTRDCLSEPVVLVWVFSVEERDLQAWSADWTTASGLASSAVCDSLHSNDIQC